MRTRIAAATLAVVLAACVLTGCAPASDPAEPAPLFTSEADAFAAAEETYRAYVDALNRVDLSDPATFEDVYAWTTGEFNANERRTLAQMHADGWTVTGQSRVASFQGLELDSIGGAVVKALVCSDVSGVEVVDKRGTSVVSTDRADVYALDVTLVEERNTVTGLAIASSNAVADDTCKS